MVTRNKTPTLQSVQEAMAAHSVRRFPADSIDDDISRVHAQLAEYDGFVVGLVFSLLRGQALNLALFKPNQQLGSDLTMMLVSKPVEANDLLKEYLAYKEELDNLLQLGMEVIRASG